MGIINSLFFFHILHEEYLLKLKVRIVQVFQLIFYMQARSPVQRSFFKNGGGNLLLALRFLDRLYNSGNFVIIFSLM